MDIPLKIRICYPFIPMLADLRHGIVLGTHICSIRPFIYYPIWFVLEYRWCYPWLLSAWYQSEFTSSTSLSDELSIQGLEDDMIYHPPAFTPLIGVSPNWNAVELFGLFGFCRILSTAAVTGQVHARPVIAMRSELSMLAGLGWG